MVLSLGGTTATTALAPAMSASDGPSWPDAVWIGSCLETIDARIVTIGSGSGYRRCRLLVRDSDDRCRGFVELSVVDGAVDGESLASAIAELPLRPGAALDACASSARAVTVAVSTRNRADQLADALDSIRALDYDDLQILVVDNASDDDATERVVTDLRDPRVRYVREDRVGLSYGRNRALLEATTPIVAFTDDDVIVDRSWVRHLVAAFASDEVALVTGMVPTGELRTPAQRYFEAQTGWQQSCLPRTFRLSMPPADVRAFPLDVGRYGTGANFAVRREVAIRLGGFNEALGIGSPTHGGEDLDMFVRTLYGGWALSYAPDAVIWHRHRADAESLQTAVNGYSVSFSAWMASLLENPVVRRDALRIGGAHVARRLSEIARVKLEKRQVAVPPATTASTTALAPGFVPAEHGFGHLRRIELRGLASGPRAYVASRRAGRRTRPLLGQRSGS